MALRFLKVPLPWFRMFLKNPQLWLLEYLFLGVLEKMFLNIRYYGSKSPLLLLYLRKDLKISTIFGLGALAKCYLKKILGSLKNTP